MEVYQQAKEAVRQLKAISNPDLHTTGLLAFAWNALSAVFIFRKKLPEAVKAAKKSHSILFQCIAETNWTPFLVLSIGSILRKVLSQNQLFSYTKTTVEKAFRLVTTKTAKAMLSALHRFVCHVNLEQCCLAAFVASSARCPEHGQYETIIFPLDVEGMLRNCPSEVLPVDEREWLLHNKVRLEAVVSADSRATGASLALSQVRERLFPVTLIATLDRLLGHTESDENPETLEQALLPMTAIRWTTHEPQCVMPDETIEDGRRHIQQIVVRWAAYCDDRLAKQGLTVTMVEIMDRFQALDKNESKQLDDYGLLAKLGLC
jgi:hypothetical protein